jgi:murein DD-endopeptidase MepM/ murein hydrolase activator NlpD
VATGYDLLRQKWGVPTGPGGLLGVKTPEEIQAEEEEKARLLEEQMAAEAAAAEAAAAVGDPLGPLPEEPIGRRSLRGEPTDGTFEVRDDEPAPKEAEDKPLFEVRDDEPVKLEVEGQQQQAQPELGGQLEFGRPDVLQPAEAPQIMAKPPEATAPPKPLTTEQLLSVLGETEKGINPERMTAVDSVILKLARKRRAEIEAEAAAPQTTRDYTREEAMRNAALEAAINSPEMRGASTKDFHELDKRILEGLFPQQNSYLLPAPATEWRKVVTYFKNPENMGTVKVASGGKVTDEQVSGTEGDPTAFQSLKSGAATTVQLAESAKQAVLENLPEVFGLDKAAEKAGANARYYSALRETLPKGMSVYQIGSVGDIITWAGNVLPEQGVLMAGPVAGGTLGKVIAGSIGSKIGAFLPSAALGIGEVQSQTKAIDPNLKANLLTLATGSAIGALDAVNPMKIGSGLAKVFGKEAGEIMAKRILLAPASSGFAGRFAALMKQGAKGGAEGLGTEGGTEFAQSLMGTMAAAYRTGTPMPPDAFANAVEEAITGAVVGGAISAPVSVAEEAATQRRIDLGPLREAESIQWDTSRAAPALLSPSQRAGQIPGKPARPFEVRDDARPVVLTPEEKAVQARPRVVRPTPAPVSAEGQRETHKPPSGKITSTYGPRRSFRTNNGQMATSTHAGLDIAKKLNAPVEASASGVVVRTLKNKGGYGNQVVIRHSDGTTSSYSHLNKIGVKVGQQVAQGQSVGGAGQTGNATGVHVHYELRNRNGAILDPRTKRTVMATQDADSGVWVDDTEYEVAQDPKDYGEEDFAALQDQEDEAFTEATGQEFADEDFAEEAEPEPEPTSARHEAVSQALEESGVPDPATSQESVSASLDEAKAANPARQALAEETAAPAEQAPAAAEGPADYTQPLEGEEPVFGQDADGQPNDEVVGFHNPDTDAVRMYGQPPEGVAPAEGMGGPLEPVPEVPVAAAPVAEAPTEEVPVAPVEPMFPVTDVAVEWTQPPEVAGLNVEERAAILKAQPKSPKGASFDVKAGRSVGQSVALGMSEAPSLKGQTAKFKTAYKVGFAEGAKALATASKANLVSAVSSVETSATTPTKTKGSKATPTPAPKPAPKGKKMAAVDTKVAETKKAKAAFDALPKAKQAEIGDTVYAEADAKFGKKPTGEQYKERDRYVRARVDELALAAAEEQAQPETKQTEPAPTTTMPPKKPVGAPKAEKKAEALTFEQAEAKADKLEASAANIERLIRRAGFMAKEVMVGGDMIPRAEAEARAEKRYAEAASIREEAEAKAPPEVRRARAIEAKYEAIDDKLADIESEDTGAKAKMRVFLNGLVKQGVLDKADFDGLDYMFKDRDMAVEDITGEIRGPIEDSKQRELAAVSETGLKPRSGKKRPIGDTGEQQKPSGDEGQRAEARGVPERGSVPRSTEPVALNRGQDIGFDKPLPGQPRKVNVPGYGDVAFGPWPTAKQVAADYMADRGLTYTPQRIAPPFDTGRATRIANLFTAMKHTPADPDVLAAYQAMADETIAQWKAIEASGLKVEFIDFEKTGDPYEATPRLMQIDVAENNHMWVFKTDDGFGNDTQPDVADNPLLALTDIYIGGHQLRVNDVFRIVHDYFGHVSTGHGFRARGEEGAWQSHASMYTPLAARAMTVETRGQNSWVNYGPHGETNRTASSADTIYAPQKIGLLPEWVSTDGALSAPREIERDQRQKDNRPRLGQPYGTAGVGGRGRDGSAVEAGEVGEPVGDTPPVDEDGNVTLDHFTLAENLGETDPRMWGRSGKFLPEEERSRIGTAPGRTYFGIGTGRPGGYVNEFRDGIHPRYRSPVYRVEAKIPLDRLYDMNGDPDGLKAKGQALPQNDNGDYIYKGKPVDHVSLYELLIRDAGYAGYWIKRLGMVAASFEPVAVTPHVAAAPKKRVVGRGKLLAKKKPAVATTPPTNPKEVGEYGDFSNDEMSGVVEAMNEVGIHNKHDVRFELVSEAVRDIFNEEAQADNAQKVAEGKTDLTELIDYAGIYSTEDRRDILIRIIALADLSTKQTARHEVMHWLTDPENGFITNAEYKILAKWVQGVPTLMKWAETNYPLSEGHTRETQIDEAIAEGYARWEHGDPLTKVRGAGPQTFVEEFFQFLRDLRLRLAVAFNKAGVSKAELKAATELMTSIRSGQHLAKADAAKAAKALREASPAPSEPGTVKKRVIRDAEPSVLGDVANPDPNALRQAHDIALNMMVRLGSANRKTGSDAADDLWDAFRRKMHQKYLQVEKAQTRAEAYLGVDRLPPEMNVMERITADERGYKTDHLIDNLFKPMAEELARSGLKVADLGLYLYARHAPARNRAVAKINPEFNTTDKPGSGMTDQQAGDIISQFIADGKLDDLQAAAVYIDKMIEMAQRERVSGKLLTQQSADKGFAPQDHYVPLRGHDKVDPELEMNHPVEPSGFSVKGPEGHRMFGRESMADLESIVGYTYAQAAQAIDRAYRNSVSEVLYNLLRAVPDPTFVKLDRVERVATWNPKTKKVEYQMQTRIKPGSEEDERTVYFKDGDTLHKMTFQKGNQSAIRFVKAIKNLDVETLHPLFIAGRTLTKLWTQANTTWNIDFILRNAVKDVQTGVINASTLGEKGIRRAIIKNLPGALYASTRGVFNKTGAGEGSGSKWFEWYHEFEAAGGKINYNQTEGLEDILKRTKREMKRAKQSGFTNPVKAAANVLGFVANLSSALENMTRLSAYVALREAGIPAKQAAEAVRELTTNFQQHGEWGPKINAFYGFATASTTGGGRFLYSLRKKPMLMVGLMTIGLMMDVLNHLLDPDKWDKYTEEEKDTAFKLMLPDWLGFDLSIPIGYGLNSFITLGRKSSEWWREKTDEDGNKLSKTEALFDVMTSFANAFSPVGGATVANLITPSIGDPLVDILQNRDNWGRKIYPTEWPGTEDDPQSHSSLDNTSEFWKVLATGMNQLTGGTDVTKGAIDVHPETLSHFSSEEVGGLGRSIGRVTTLPGKLAAGEAGPNDLPIIRGFITAPHGADNVDKATISTFNSRYYPTDKAIQKAKDVATRYGLDSPQYKAYYADHKAAIKMATAAKVTGTALKKISTAKGDLEEGLVNAGGLTAKQVKAIETVTGDSYPEGKKLTQAQVDASMKKIEKVRLALAKKFDEIWQKKVMGAKPESSAPTSP